MISAVADSCSVRLDKVNRRVYKFHALIFNEGCEGNNKLRYLHPETRTKGEGSGITRPEIVCQQSKTEWKKSASNELLNDLKELPKCKLPTNVSPPEPRRKKSKTTQELSNDTEERQKVRFEESEACVSCLHLANHKEKYDSLMAKPKEELVSMIMELDLSLRPDRRRKKGYIPSEEDLVALRELETSASEVKTEKKHLRTWCRQSRNKRLTSI